MKRWFRLLLLGLVLLLVSLVSALTAMRIAIHGREVRVPNLAGMTTGKADEALSYAGLVMEIEDHFYSATVPQGAVLSQVPAAGTRVRRGWHVRVGVSLGSTHASVPDVVGESGRAGEINVQRRGLELGTVAVAHLPSLPPDQVIAESPPPGTRGMTSPKVNLLITAPEQDQTYVMPDLSGRTLGQAAQTLQNAGLKLGNFPLKTAREDSGPQIPPELVAVRVNGQSPAAGQRVSPGTVVMLQMPAAPPSPPPNSPQPNAAPSLSATTQSSSSPH
jgi:beta-lactam-binding protein with PASTA domain